jgi:hypothetical protein
MTDETTEWRKPGRCSSCVKLVIDFGEAPDLYGHCKRYSRSGSRQASDYACELYKPLEGFAELTRSADHERNFSDPKLIRANRLEAKNPRKRRTSPAAAGARRMAEQAQVAQTAVERLRSWEDATAGRGPSDATHYTITGDFKIGDLLSHATYGLGVVESTVDRNKVRVIFKSGPRVLIIRFGQ